MNKETLSSLLFPIMNGIMFYIYHKEDFLEIYDKTKFIKNEVNDMFIVYVIITIIQVFLLVKSNKYSHIIISLMWIVYMIVYDLIIRINKDMNIFYSNILSEYQKNIKSDLKIDSMVIFKIIYFILAVVLLVNKNSSLNILILIFCGILFQLINSLALYLFNTKTNIIPSVFMYLNELINNGYDSNKRNNNNRIFGYIKLIFLIVISFVFGWKISNKKNNAIKLISIYSILTIIILLWIILIGDKSIIQRTNVIYKDKGYLHEKDLIKHFMPVVIRSQGGIIFNLLLIYISFISKNYLDN